MGDDPEKEDGDNQRDGNDSSEAVSSLVVRDDGRRGAAMVFDESWDVLL